MLNILPNVERMVDRVSNDVLIWFNVLKDKNHCLKGKFLFYGLRLKLHRADILFQIRKNYMVDSHLNKKYQSQVLMFPEAYLYLRFSPVSLIDLSMLD